MSHISPSSDDGIVEINDVWDGIGWDGDMRYEETWVGINTSGWGVSWIFRARDVSSMDCTSVLLE